MKKITLFMLFLSTMWGYSQVKNYTFSQTTGTYAEITGALLGGSSTHGQNFLDAAVVAGSTASTGVGLPIGFDFVFNGFTYNRFGINTNGWIALGTSTLTPSVNMSVSSSTSPLSSSVTLTSDALSARISALSKDLQGQADANIQYTTLGSSPDRILVVQWKKFRKNGATGDSFDFQIRLNETSNKVEIVYGTFVSNATAGALYQAGLRAEPSVTPTNYTLRKSTTGWDNTTIGFSAGDTVLMSDVLKPVSGLTFAWTPGTCGGAKSFTISAVTETAATFSWDSYAPIPTGYEYVVTTALTLPTGSGTAVIGGTVVMTDLIPDTAYNVFVRSVCGTDFSTWVLEGSFRTKCAAMSAFVENFDSLTAGTTVMPSCWGKGGSASTYVSSGANYPVSAPNFLYMSASTTTKSYAVLPRMTNLQAETNRLKFKAFATVAGGKLDVGYYTDPTDVSTFALLQSIDLPSTTFGSAIEFVVTPKSIPAGVTCLGFRNSGLTPNFPTIYIDDVIWEPIPSCLDVKSLMVSNILSTSIKLSWTPTGTETAWQYVYAPSTVKVPSGLTPVDAASSTLTIDGLLPTTSYSVWVRSKCGDTYGVWIGPLNFTTQCTQGTIFMQNFDTLTSPLLPSCWTKLGTGNVTTSVTTPSSAPNALSLYNGSATAKGIAAMEPVSNAGASTNRLKFKLRGSAVGNSVEVGYLKVYNDETSFTLLQSFAATSKTTYDNIVMTFGSTPTTPYLAFRATGTSSSSSVFIDDVVWEPTPSCADITNLTLTSTRSDSVDLSWTPGGTENVWQYAVGTSATTNPYSLAAVDFASAPSVYQSTVSGTIGSLIPSTSYMIWVRSKCGSGSGAWIGPLSLSTTCAPVTEFTQNFDAGTAFPSCWSKVGTGGTVTISATTGTGSSNGLSINSTKTSFGMVAMQPVSNSADGDHLLRFQLRGSVENSVIEVGFVKSIGDPSSFSKLLSFTAPSTTDYFPVAAVLGYDPASEVLAFRNPGAIASTVYIDDVTWVPLPSCADITDLAIDLATSKSLDLTWTIGGSETQWQYVIGGSTDSNPKVLTAVDFAAPVINGKKVKATVSNLVPNTPYKVWVRPKCSANDSGFWIGPMSFTTTCTPITEFSQNFDSQTMPACWSKVGAAGSFYIDSVDGPGAPNEIEIGSSSAADRGILALPPVSNADAGTHRLKFKIRGSADNTSIEVGYLNNISDPNSFQSFQLFTASSTITYEDKISLIVTTPGRQVLAFRNPGLVSAAMYIDNVVWEAIPPCADIKKVVTNGTTSSTANISLTTDISTTACQYVLGSSTTTDPSTLTPVNATSPSFTITDLTPGTTYNIWVRSKCSDTSFGIWLPLTFTTTCAPVAEFTQNFNGNNMPDCWFKIGSGTVTVNNSLGIYGSTVTGSGVVALPAVSNATAGTNRLKFKFRSAVDNGMLELGYVTDVNDADTFVPLESYVSNSTSLFQNIITALPKKPIAGSILAFRNPATPEGYVSIDDVIWESIPTTIPACPTVTTVADSNCGNFNTSISWPALAGIDGYRLTMGTTSGGSDVVNKQDIGSVLTYSFKGKTNTTYYFTIASYNAVGEATGCVEQSFKTAANNCYCTSVPTSIDGMGITKVQLGGSNFSNSNVTYKNFTNPVNLAQGINANLKISYNTGTSGYNTYVWIDFNDNYDFELSELVLKGQAVITNPSVLDATFMMPVTAQLGTHGLRIVAANSSQYPFNPCYGGSLGVTLDFKVNIVAANAIANDEAAAATALTVGPDFASHAIMGSNVDSTGSVVEPAPGCGNYNGNDVWYKAAVPSSGNVTFEVNSVPGGVTNTAAAVYYGSSGTLFLVSCDDSSSTAGDDQPKISVSGRKPGEDLFLRVWENGGDAYGAFKVSAYDATAGVLGIDDLDSVNFSYYPNPVTDVLNLSFSTEISNVSVVNLLGQQVISKSLNANRGKIDMSGLSKGAYLVKVTVGNQSKTIKVIKE